ncbi:MAG: hypothetical protein ABI868_01025 [Acidobacteriota bacterium]
MKYSAGRQHMWKFNEERRIFEPGWKTSSGQTVHLEGAVLWCARDR